MLLTAPLLSKSSFFGSLLNKCRPAAANLANHTAGLKTLEEKVGLPPRPKKPLTPYFRYMQESRSKVLSENPKASNIEVVRIIAKNWKTADETMKQRLQDEFKKDQQKYVEVRTKYDANVSDEKRAEIKQLKQDVVEAKERKIMRKRFKDLGRPKKPASAFLRFLIKERTVTPQTPKQTYKDWHKKCSAKWITISEEEKDAYKAEARVELDQYKKDMTVWEEKMIRLGNIDVVRHSNLVDPPEPKPRKQTH